MNTWLYVRIGMLALLTAVGVTALVYFLPHNTSTSDAPSPTAPYGDASVHAVQQASEGSGTAK